MSLLLIEGWTERIQVTLMSDGVATDLTGMTVQVVAYNSAGTVTLTGTAGVVTPSAGIVYFDPAPGDLVKGTLKVRWKVTNSGGKVAFFPNSVQPDIWTISKA